MSELLWRPSELWPLEVPLRVFPHALVIDPPASEVLQRLLDNSRSVPGMPLELVLLHMLRLMPLSAWSTMTASSFTATLRPIKSQVWDERGEELR